MATFDFQKLGSDRFAQNIKRAVSNPVGTINTGDVSKGTVVTVGPDFTGNSTSATVAPRRTGAIMIARDGDSDTFLHSWTITGTTLTVVQNNAVDTTYTFWVF